jgi:eukaryotic-like serine/threonine-protein kinase
MARAPASDVPGAVEAVSVIESTIEGRYQVVTRVASGGMGEVYRAHDAVLGREVAIKVLHPQFAGDRGFVDRFRREARAAAILNHPNIVGVFDWGSTDGTYFMVMEYVPGLNLRTLLSEYGRLEAAQVVEVGLQVLAALDHAHRHGIVHRDVKPENILIAQDGAIKVADFGLARAYAESSVSQAEGTVTGTVQYLAPEQIQGQPADPRTDLYAFGVVTFELLTGHPPFTGETSLAIAYQHLSSPVPAPSTVIPDVPAALDSVVLRATEKERDRRPASARSMRDEFALMGVGLPPGRPVVELAAQIPPADLVAQDRATTVTIPRARSPRARRARRVKIVAAVLFVLVLLGTGAWAAWLYAVPHYTRVPNVLRLTPQRAAARLEAAGLEVTIGRAVFSPTVESGLVLETRPPPGTRLQTRTPVVLITSLGPELLSVPRLEGKAQAAAVRAIREAGFEPKTRQEFHERVREGRVISQSPDPGQKIERGSVVTIVVSKGPAPVEVPDVVGQLGADARATLEAFGFAVKRLEEFSTSVPKGEVIRTNPQPGTVAARGSTVTMVVSLGPKTFPMPDVVGMSGDEAEAKLRALGLEVIVVPVPSVTPPNTVVFQDPDPDTTVQQGQEVTIFVTES